jgi:hypothetical protein
MIDISFRPLLQAAFLAGRDVGRWEAGATPEDRSGGIVLSPSSPWQKSLFLELARRLR